MQQINRHFILSLSFINALNMFNCQLVIIKHTNLKEGVINHQVSNKCFCSTIKQSYA